MKLWKWHFSEINTFYNYNHLGYSELLFSTWLQNIWLFNKNQGAMKWEIKINSHLSSLQWVRKSVYIFISFIGMSSFLVYVYVPGDGKHEIWTNIGIHFVIYCQYKMSDFCFQTSQHYKIMVVPFTNSDKLIERVRSI